MATGQRLRLIHQLSDEMEPTVCHILQFEMYEKDKEIEEEMMIFASP